MKWFQVDADTPNDPKFRAVYRALGLEGVGGLFLLWCFIADHGTKRPGCSIDSAGHPIPIADLRDASKLDEQKFSELITICLSIGHFDKRPWTTRKVIAIPAMSRRADTYTKRNVRRGFEQSRTFVEQSSSTRQDSTNKTVPPVVPHGGRRRRKGLNFDGRTCQHEPKCQTFKACTDRTLREARMH